jgi:PAS domain S-box-containing protein
VAGPRPRRRSPAAAADLRARAQRCEHRFTAADGSVRWLRTSIHLADTVGEAPQLQGVSFDITVARAAQDQIREQLSFTRAMASSLAEGTLAVDLEDRITFINDAAAGLLGCTDRDMLGTASAALVHVRTVEDAVVESPLDVAIRTGRVRNDAHRFVRNDRRSFLASYTATPIRRDGKVTGAVLAFDDISERKLAQEAEHFLSSAAAMLSASLESTTVAGIVARCGVPVLGDVCFLDVVSTDDQLQHAAIAHAEPALLDEIGDLLAPRVHAAVFAVPIAEVILTGQSLRAASLPDAWFSPGDLAIVQRLGIRSALIVPLVLGTRSLGALTFCMTGDHEHRASDVALAEELARRSALAIEHARLYEQARQAVAMREQTLAIVSHDLRTPLATIVMATSILSDDEITRMDPRAKVLALDKIQSAAHRMDRMIGDLLDFASIEVGQLSMVIAPHDVGGIIDETMASFETAASKRRVALTAEHPAAPVAILCDRDRILQIIANLVGNALKSAAPGDAVRLSTRVAGRDVEFSVADTGPGIAAANQKRLFERYWRSPDAGYKGTGLGLAIARGLVEAHHGRLWVESQLGHGATFSFTVPLAGVSHADAHDEPYH